MGIKGMKWEISAEQKNDLQMFKRIMTTVVAEYLSVVGPTMTVVGYMLWIAYSAGINELVGYPYKGMWLLIAGLSLATMGVLGLAIRACRAIWRRIKDSDLLTDDVKAEWPDWLK